MKLWTDFFSSIWKRGINFLKSHDTINTFMRLVAWLRQNQNLLICSKQRDIIWKTTDFQNPASRFAKKKKNAIKLTSPCNEHHENLTLKRERWVNIFFFLFLLWLKNIVYGNLLTPQHRGASKEHNLCLR